MNADFTSIIINLSKSMAAVQDLVTGAGYLIGITFMFTGVSKLKKLADARTSGGSHGTMFVPVTYFVMGALLIYLPSAISVFSHTAFGTGNILQYTNPVQMKIYPAVKTIVQTAGVIWFVRGAVLLAHASQPGVQEGPKGLVFLITGVFAINFQESQDALNSALHWLQNISPQVSNTLK